MIDLLKSKLSFKHLLGVLVIFGSLIWLTVFSFPDSRLHLIFCDVGQGDAILITKGFEQILIDGGPNDKVLRCLTNNMPFFDKTIEVVALTHPEADHLTGLLSVFDKYQVDVFLVGVEGDSSALFKTFSEKLRAKSEKSQLKIKNVYTGETVRINDIFLQTLWPQREWVAGKLEVGSENWEAGDISLPTSESSLAPQTSHFILGAKTTHSKLNDFSLVFLLNYQNHKILLMGDADSSIQDDILRSNNLMPVDVLKFPHHGSKTGISSQFLEKTKPKEAVISVGRNSYGHPTNEALSLLEKYGVKIRRTDLEGEIHYQF